LVSNQVSSECNIKATTLYGQIGSAWEAYLGGRRLVKPPREVRKCPPTLSVSYGGRG
jgi:hypothetical protein